VFDIEDSTSFIVALDKKNNKAGKYKYYLKKRRQQFPQNISYLPSHIQQITYQTNQRAMDHFIQKATELFLSLIALNTQYEGDVPVDKDDGGGTGGNGSGCIVA